MMDSENPKQKDRKQLCQKDVHAVKEVISKVKSQGLFDQFRKECLADVDTKPAYHNLVHRVEKFVEIFLEGQKWSTDLNKNQLRETLRRHLNNSGVMNMGVDRIIEQVVNPKILLGIKPKIDEAVCDHLGIDLKVRQEEQQKQKQEQQQFQQQQFHQNHLQNLITQNVKAVDNFGMVTGILPSPSTFPWPQASVDGSFSGTANSRMTDLATTASGVNFNPHTMGFGGMMQHNFMGSWAPGLPGMEGFNQTMRPVLPDQPVILDFGGGYSPTVAADKPFIPITSPPLENVNTSFSIPSMQIQPLAFKSVHDFASPPLGPPGNHLLISASNIGSSPEVLGFSQQPSFVAPPGILTHAAGTIIKPPPPGSIPPPPGTVPVIPPTLFTPCQTTLQQVPSTHIIPSLISHTVPKVLKEESPLEEVKLVIKTEEYFTEKYFTEQQIQSDEQITEFQWVNEERSEEETTRKAPKIKFEDREDSAPLKHNLMDIFQDGKGLSENENTFNLSIDPEETTDEQNDANIGFDDFGKQHLPTGQSGKGMGIVQSVALIVIYCTYLLGKECRHGIFYPECMRCEFSVIQEVLS